MVARAVTLEDWNTIAAAWREFQGGRYGGVIEDGEGILRPTFIMSLPPHSPVKVFGLFDDGRCKAAGAVQECFQPVPSEDGWSLTSRPYTFIRSVFSLPGTPRAAMRQLDKVVIEWAKSRGHVAIQGNCRLNFPERLAAMYGYYPQATIFGKRLEE